MTMSISYAVAVLYALTDDPGAYQPEKTVLCAIETCLNADHTAIRKTEWINATRWLLRKVKESQETNDEEDST